MAPINLKRRQVPLARIPDERRKMGSPRDTDKLTFTRNTASLPYRMLRPEGYDKGGDDRYPLGVKGMGELGMLGIPAAIANAVFHATDKRIRGLPITPEKLL
jgi:hypothetical protein